MTALSKVVAAMLLKICKKKLLHDDDEPVVLG